MTHDMKHDMKNDMELRNGRATEARNFAGPTQALPKGYPSFTQGLGLLKSMARVWLEYAKSMARVWLEYAKGMPIVRPVRTHRPLRFALRLAAVLLVMIVGAQSAKAADYVLTYTTGGTTYYLARNGTSGVVSTSSFNPTTCVWTCVDNTSGTTENTLGTSGNRYIYQTVDGTKYFLNYNLGLTATTANDYCRVRNSDYGVYFRSSTRYILLSTNGTVSYGNYNSTGRVTRYQVTTTTVIDVSTNPTINGDNVLTTTGNHNYTATGAAFRIGYKDYYFNSTDHYVDAGGNSITPANATIGSPNWSLTENNYATVNSSSGTVTISTLPESDITLTLTVTIPVDGGVPAAPSGTTLSNSKEITIQGTKPSAPTISVSGTSVTMSTDAAGTTSIRYTLDGSDPTATSGTVYSGTIDLSSSTTSPVTIKAITVRNGNASDVTTETVTLTLPEPTITADGDAGTATITCDITGATIYYTTDGTEPTTLSTQYSSSITGLSMMTTIKAIAVKSGWNNSPVASELVTISSGTSGGTVTLFDYEDHNWTYYSGVDTSVDNGNYNTNYLGKIYSPNPRNVKITYRANNGAVSIDESDTVFVYYKTLEQGTTAGQYPYTVISNPFSKRPNGKGFGGWKIKEGADYISGYADEATLPLDAEIVFTNLPYPSVNCTSAEIELEATWVNLNNIVRRTNTGDYTYSTTGGTYETNILVIQRNQTGTITASSPVTIMMVEPDGSADYRGSYTFTGNITPNNNGVTKIEFTKWVSTNTVNAGYRHLWIGRGMTTTSGNRCANLITGTNSGTSVASPQYSIKVESGVYQYFDFYKGHSTYTGGTDNTGFTVSGSNANAKITMGNDYDRAKGANGNGTLQFSYGPMFGYSGSFSTRGNRDNTHTLDLVVKSGTIGSTFFIENTNTATYLQGGAGYCMYLSSAGSQTNVGTRNVIIEGGDICSIGGGIDSYNNAPSGNDTPSSTTSYNRLSLNLRIKGGTIHGNVYGGAAKSPSGGNRVMVMTGGQVKGWFAAGCNGTDNDGGQNYGTSYVYIGGKGKVDSEGLTKTLGYANGGNVYAAGAGRTGATTCGEMTFGSNLVIADESSIERGAYGGGNYGYAKASTNIYITGGTNDGDDGTVNNVTTKGGVFGGANQQNGPNVNIYMTGGTMKGGVYGGCNTQGTISNNVTMQINGGQVGTPSQTANIHGGGYGQNTVVSGNVDLTLGTTNQIEPGVTVYGDVYGGSALGSVNGTSANTTYHTNVTLNKGIINGSLYGGALGDLASLGTGHSNVAANVYAPVAVKVYGGSVRKTDANGANGSGGVYGANNVNGAPQRSVTVDIYGTDQPESGYALYAVYGGGNKADYTYTTASDSYPKVTVHNCDNSIEYVYGGGNAAAVAATDVTIYGGNVIGNVFGGGNGTVTAANVSGNTLTKIYGGTILKVFGGSNSQGTIGGTITVNAESQTESGTNPVTGTAFERCPMHVDELYGGGNKAASNVGSISIGCMGDNDMINYVYGGANQADITGDISLTMTGGRIGNLFGGNNTNGNISGSITVTVNWTTGQGACTNNYLGNVFGGGNLATIGTAGSPKAPTVNIYNGTVSGNVYGGGKGLDSDHTKGQVTGNPVVTIGDNVNGHTAVVTGDVYGGGDAGNVVGTPQVNVINKCNTSIGNVYGGGNAADVEGTDVNIDGGTITGMVFGGGHGDKNSSPQKEANVNGNVAVDVTGGTIAKVFGGSNSKGTISGTVAVNIEKDDNSCEMHITEVYGGGNEAAGNAGTLTIGCTGDYTNNSEGIGDVYGGANQADIGNNISLTIRGGHIDRVFGGNNTSGSISGTIAVTVNWDDNLSCDKYLGNVFGGGNLAAYAGSPTVTLTNGTVSHNIYGGGNEAGVGGSTVNINGGQVVEGIYGGCNTSGTVTGAIAVNINGGTLGTSSTHMTSGIFGGGYGASTATEGNVTVTIGDVAGTYTPTIYADIYGGSALGDVNKDANNTTTINFLNGTLHGNLYGGGLGDASNAAKVNGQVIVNISNTTQTAAQCKIDLRDATIYGCNNTNGSPQDDVTVNIYKTAYNYNDYQNGDKYKATYTEAVNNVAPAYAIDQVFGGGNQADYAPEDGAADSDKKAIVHIYDCENTVRRVFGGGNAAAATGVQTIIEGGRYDYVFGGGNGEVIAANIGAGGTDLQVHGGNIHYLFGGSNHSGTITGQMGVQVDATSSCGSTMYIAEFFCGNNEAPVNTDITATIGCGTIFGDVYGGCNLATITGDVNLTIEGGTMNNVYGGSKGNSSTAANIDGDVTLNITGGSIGNAFGGSNINGNITGSITVNVEKATNPCIWSLGNVYGASNEAAYTPTTPGSYPAVNIKNGAVTGSVFGGGLGATATVTSNPVVTIGDNTTGHDSYVASVGGDVYGGGDAGNVVGTPQVNVVNKCNTTISGDVYGGGNAANVSSTEVNIDGGTITGRVFGGGHGDKNSSPQKVANVNGDVEVDITGGTISKVFGGSNSKGDITGTVTVNIEKESTSCDMKIGEVYGGGNEADGNAGTITIGCTGGWTTTGTHNHTNANTTDNRIGYELEGIGAVYGGANQANIGTSSNHSDITLNINSGIVANVYGGNNTSGNIYGSITVNINQTGSCDWYVGNVFGGGNLAQYTSTNDNNGNPTYPHVNVLNGTVSGNVYGGGKGNLVDGNDRGTAGKVTGNPTVNIGDNTNGHTAIVLGDVYGGGDAADVDGTPAIVVNDCNTEIGYLYGGGNAADVNGTNITVDGGTIHNDAFGGGHGDKDASNPSKYADVKGNVVFNVYGGTIGRVFAGSNSKGEITGTSALTINKTSSCDMKIGEVYGGGNEANGNAGSVTIGCTGDYDDQATYDANHRIGYEYEGIGAVYGGANQANIGADGTGNESNITLTINSGIVDNVYGGNNSSGTIYGTIQVNINKNAETCGWYVGNVFGGGNVAAYSGTPDVNIINGTVSGSVYGGGNEAGVGGGDVTMTGGTVLGGIYGGCNTSGIVGGDIVVTISAGTVGDSQAHANVHGGGYGSATETSGNVTVNIGTISGSTPSGAATIYGDVYGGSALGSVNEDTDNTTAVNLYGGTIYGDAYGGGLGDANNAAAVNGNVTVTLDGVAFNISKEDDGTGNLVPITGRVFGCNNVSGTPLGTVTVHVKRTKPIGGGSHTDSDYEVQAVYGGGNMASYVPTSATQTEVIIDGCDDTSIEYVYGGGNAAAVPGTHVTINGTFEIDYVFGGGNGKDKTKTSNGWVVNNGADVGVSNQTNYLADPDHSTGTYGTGKTHVEIRGGTIHHAFGGSNTLGYIAGEAKIALGDEDPSCPLIVDEVYAAGNEAELYAEAIMEMHCIDGVERLFGGARNADVTENIVMNVTGGTYNQVFGGNNEGGCVHGSITINIEQTGCLPIVIGELYGGGYKAGYSVYGYDANGTPLKKDDTGALSESEKYANPTINIKSAKSIGSVFGGGLEAVVIGDPIVNINMVNGWVNGDYAGDEKLADNSDNPNYKYNTNKVATFLKDISGDGTEIGAIGTVFGGGNQGDVIGSTTVNIGDQTSVTLESVATNDRRPTGVPNGAKPSMTVKGANITGNVYGGGNAADVTGKTNVTIGKEN